MRRLGGCKITGLSGVAVTATGGPGGTARTSTGSNGTYSVKVDKGTWKVTPSLDGRDFDPPARSVQVGGDAGGVDFKTCAKKRQTQAVGATSSTTTSPACNKLDVDVQRIKAAGDTGWTESSGKKYLGNAQMPVGFGQPTKNGDFCWQCRTGCFNIRVHVRDAKSHLPPTKLVRVKVTALFLGKPLDALDGSRHGTLCQARSKLSDDCTGKLLTSQIDRKTGNLDLYYWVPGVVKPETTVLNCRAQVEGATPT